jgi:DNA invertase Pin-like site-specific DNA recombinase
MLGKPTARAQQASVVASGADELYAERQAVGVEQRQGDRPVLAKALAACASGDTFAAFKLDRVGRSLVHLTKILEDLEAKGVHFLTTEDGLSTKGSTGKRVLHILGAIAQFERSLMLERTRAGLCPATIPSPPPCAVPSAAYLARKPVICSSDP